MLDIKFIRENKDLVADAARRKRVDFDVEALLAVDDRRKAALGSIEAKRAEQNAASDKISQAAPEARQALIAEMTSLKAALGKEEEEYKEIMREWQGLMVRVPNIPDMSVPQGDSDADNQEVKVWGEKPQFSFAPKSHVELMEKHKMVDLERGAKVAGFRGYFLTGAGAELNFALWKFIIDFWGKKGFTFMIAPSLVKREPFMGTGYLPQSEEDLYKTQDGEYLAGTSEVAAMGYHMDETLERTQLPTKFFAFSPCFRREAGSHGKDTKGIMRVHEFFKFEQVVLC
ncbi:MAG TPA: DUF349 domain-containing protein, partial [Candidatus Paceibacterota bacterium]|nr:DUF349 domain-containing protein [Candidatus Paceibacterota bacterium]